MTRELALSLIRAGNTGDEILRILDTIATPDEDATPAGEPTLDPIQF
jgi:hypothetical protein